MGFFMFPLPHSSFQYLPLPHSLASFLRRKTMKIFNWMHKKFHPQNNTLKDGYASNMKKNEPTTLNKVDNQALLKQVAMTDFLGGWRDGILTIGTLGCDINHHKDYFALEVEDEKVKVGHTNDDENFYNDEQEELNPLMYNTFDHNFDDVICEKNHDDDKEEEVVTTNNRTLSEVVQVEPMICHEIIEYNDDDDVEADQKKKGGERITLADLFLADSDVKLKLDYPKVLFESIEKGPNLKAKHGFSFAKKIIPLVKDNARPIKDIKKLMKKVLKRKVHPDLEVKNHKGEDEEVNNEAGNIIDNNMNEGSDSSYFLPILRY